MDSSTTRPTPSRPSRSTTVCTPFGPLAVRNTRPDGASPTSKKSRPTSTPAAHNAVIAPLLCSSLSATRFAPATVRKSTLASAPLPASRRQNQGPNELRSPAIKPQPDHHANTQGPKLRLDPSPKILDIRLDLCSCFVHGHGEAGTRGTDPGGARGAVPDAGARPGRPRP